MHYSREFRAVIYTTFFLLFATLVACKVRETLHVSEPTTVVVVDMCVVHDAGMKTFDDITLQEVP